MADEPKRARHCGDCQLCCKLMPVKDLLEGTKPASTRCIHQCRKGCGIYRHRPMSCRAFSCYWRLGSDVGQRPDRSHLVVDPIPDYVTVVPWADDAAEPGPPQDIAVIQVWVDQAHPDAHRDPAFRRWLDGQKKMAIIRYDSVRAFVLMPPSVNDQGIWVEKDAQCEGRPESTLLEVMDKVGDQLGNISIRISP